MNIHFISFATSNWKYFKPRYIEQLDYIQNKYNFFKTFDLLNEDDLTDEYYNCIKDNLNKEWDFYLKSWKPYIIKKKLICIPDNDFLLYMDGGCSIIDYKTNNPSLFKIKEIISIMNDNNYIALTKIDPKKIPVKKQIRKEVLNVFELQNDSNFLDLFPHYQTGIIFLYKCKGCIELITKWWDYYLKYPQTINFCRNDKNNQEKYFLKSNRDQPILQCLLYRDKINVLNLNKLTAYITRIKK